MAETQVRYALHLPVGAAADLLRRQCSTFDPALSSFLMQGLPPPVMETAVRYMLQLPGGAAADLLAMTPYAHHRGAAKQQGSCQRDSRHSSGELRAALRYNEICC